MSGQAVRYTLCLRHTQGAESRRAFVQYRPRLSNPVQPNQQNNYAKHIPGRPLYRLSNMMATHNTSQPVASFTSHLSTRRQDVVRLTEKNADVRSHLHPGPQHLTGTQTCARNATDTDACMQKQVPGANTSNSSGRSPYVPAAVNMSQSCAAER